MKIKFIQLTTPTPEIAKTFNKWANDSKLRPLMRPNRNQADIDEQISVTEDSLTDRLKHNFIYLLYLNDQLVGEINFQISFGYLYKQEPGTAWVGIAIGEAFAREKGIGTKALVYLEK